MQRLTESSLPNLEAVQPMAAGYGGLRWSEVEKEVVDLSNV